VYQTDNSYMNKDTAPLLVELYLERAHIFGACRDVQERRRLIDVLNHQDETLALQDVQLSLGSGPAKHYEEMHVLKSSILAAVPRETQEQSRRRAVLTNIAGKQETRQMSLALLLPPIAVEGAAHMPVGAGVTSIKSFTKFFPLTDATLSMAGNADRELDVIIVSRDRVLAVSELPLPKLAQAI
jgi:hypothetical protein